MKIKILTFAVAVFLSSNLFSQSGALDFQISNFTGFDLHYIYTTPSNTASWGDDILPYDIFSNASTVNVSVPVYNTSICQHDLRIEDMEGAYVEFSEIDLCIVSKVTLYMENGNLMYRLE